MNKTEVYSWRLSRDMKISLEEAALRKQKSISQLLETIVNEWLAESYQAGDSRDDEEQARLQEAAATCFSAFGSENPERSESIRQELRARLAKRRGN